MTRVLFAVKPDGRGGYTGSVYLSLPNGGAVKATATAATKPEVAIKAASLAEQAFSNPVVQALMPPQAAVAVKALKMVGADAAAGKLASSVKRFAGPAAARLGKVLGGLF